MPTSIRLEDTIEKRLDNLARETGRTKAYYLRELIARGLDDVEDYYLAEQVVERVESGQEKTYSLDDVENSLDLDS